MVIIRSLRQKYLNRQKLQRSYRQRTLEAGQEMDIETNEGSSVEKAQSIKEDSEDSQESAEETIEPEEVSMNQPVALMLVQSTEAGPSVLPVANGTNITDKDAGQEDQGEVGYVTGIRLILAVIALILSATLIFLDNSILSTVCNWPGHLHTRTLIKSPMVSNVQLTGVYIHVRQSQPLPTSSTPQQILAGMSAHINLPCKSSTHSLKSRANSPLTNKIISLLLDPPCNRPRASCLHTSQTNGPTSAPLLSSNWVPSSVPSPTRPRC